MVGNDQKNGMGQGISSHNMDPSTLQYSVFRTKRVDISLFLVIIGLGNGSVMTKHQATTLTNIEFLSTGTPEEKLQRGLNQNT